MTSYLTQEDGSSRLTLEDSSGFLILEDDPAAFFPAGSLGCASTKSTGQTLSMSPSRDVPLGSMVVVWAAWIGDRNYDDAAGLMDTSLACTDSEGNVYST